MAQQYRTNYQRLRSAYNLAFGQLATEMQQLNDLHATKGVETRIITQAEQKVARAHCLYLETRNALADFLIAKKDQHKVVTSLPRIASNASQLASIEERAYFMWLNAGKPSGSDQANWYRAEAGRR